ncbi:hypothetical protein GCM10027443_13830 [Pontibacter brevis]
MQVADNFFTEQPFFSIIIPTFNSEKVIETCLESLGSQTFTNFEVVVVDGNSKDNTKQTVTRFINKLNINFASEKDTGIYDAYNKGLRRAQGNWLLFLGSDDRLYNNDVLNTVFKYISENNAEVVYGDIKIEGSSAWWKDGQIYGGEFNLRKILNQNISHQAIFYKKALFDKIGCYNQKYLVCADYDFNLRCFVHSSPKYLDIIVSVYTADGSSTTTHDPEWLNNKKFIIIEHFKDKLHKKEFIGYKYLIAQLILDKSRNYSLQKRLYFAGAFAVLMGHALLDSIKREFKNVKS